MRYLDPPIWTDNKSFLAAWNKHRKANKGKWIAFDGYVKDKQVGLKSYDTYLQIFRIDGKSATTGVMDQPVKSYVANLESFLKD